MGGGKRDCMIRAVIEVALVYPYSRSMGTLAEFCSLWDSRIFSGGTRRRMAVIAIPSHHFKTIFGTNPSVGKYNVPSGMEKFIESLKVKKVLVK